MKSQPDSVVYGQIMNLHVSNVIPTFRESDQSDRGGRGERPSVIVKTSSCRDSEAELVNPSRHARAHFPFEISYVASISRRARTDLCIYWAADARQDRNVKPPISLPVTAPL